jgi:hypothetical protein
MTTTRELKGKGELNARSHPTAPVKDNHIIMTGGWGWSGDLPGWPAICVMVQAITQLPHSTAISPNLMGVRGGH